MSVDAKAARGTTPEGAGTESAAGRDAAGLVFARMTVAPALLALAWLLSGLVFFSAGWFRPVPVTVLAVVLAVPLLWFGLRAVPVLPGRVSMALPGTERRTPWWPLAAVALIAVAFLAYQVAYHGQWVVITRDPAAYFQYGRWLAENGTSRVPSDSAVFGGTHGGAVMYDGYGTYVNSDSSTVILQFMAGMPMVLAGVIWAGGDHAAMLATPVLAALALVTLAGLAARLVGARWAPLVALISAVSLPVQYTSRVTYSEPLAEIMLLGGLAFVMDGVRRGREDQGGRASRAARLATGLGGLLLGLAILVRIDGLSDLLPVVPFCGALFVRRRPQAGWLAAGLAVGAVLGLGEGFIFSWPYLMVANRTSVVPLMGLSAFVVAATAAGTWFFRRRPLPDWWKWLSKAALPASFLILLAFALRPLLGPAHFTDASGNSVRSYAEISLHWVSWYLGIPIIILAAAGAGLLARACLRGRGGDWGMPLMVMSWAMVEFLYRPSITADQPWGSRRLVPAVLPSFILLAVWAIAAGSAWLARVRAEQRRSLLSRLGPLRPVLAVIFVLAAVIPAVTQSWGLGVARAGGVHLTADGLASQRTLQGELQAMNKVCSALPANAAVIFLGTDEAPMMIQSIRAMCGVPVSHAATTDDYGKQTVSAEGLVQAVKSATASVRRSGRTPVILASGEAALAPYQASGAAKQVFTLKFRSDPYTFGGPPGQPSPGQFQVWMLRPLAQF